MAPPKAAVDFVDFINASPTPYHAVASAAARFESAGFKVIKERDSWTSTIQPGGKYYVTRNGSSIAAFTVGKKWKPGNPFAMIGAHTDSPCLRVKPASAKTVSGYLQVGVETYGGGIWHSWFDRDLSLAGRVLVKEGDQFVQKLVKVEKPLIRIPTLAIHLSRQSTFDPNKETELYPIAGLAQKELNKADKPSDGETEVDSAKIKAMSERHHPRMLEIVAQEAGVDVADIEDFELVLYDTQKSCIGGLDDEFIFSPRLDNMGMTYASVMGLIASTKDQSSLDNDTTVRLTVCFDHEEIGSVSAQGAQSTFLPSIVQRLCRLSGSSAFSATQPAHQHTSSSSDASYEKVSSPSGGSSGDDPSQESIYDQTCARSFLVSADMAHAIHPNYSSKHEAAAPPQVNAGTVIKVNANQRYMTNSPGIVLLQECARQAKVPLQLFVGRNDIASGSTIGPGLAARLGVRTLDLGNPQLSMHSIRETGGTEDVGNSIKLFEEFFHSYGKMEPRILID